MIKKIFISILIVAVFNLVISCSITTSHTVAKEEVMTTQEIINEIVLTDGNKISYDSGGGKSIVKNNYIEGITLSDKPMYLSLLKLEELTWSYGENVKDINIDKPNDFLNRVTKDKGQLGLEFEQIKVSRIVTLWDSTYIFNEDGGKFIDQRLYVIGLTPEKEFVETKSSDILYARISKTDGTGSFLASIGMLAGIFVGLILIVALTKQSCPFVYSFDGERYVFDGEPLGGATTKGLERAELSKLEYLEDVDGKYKLLVKNEVPETQYIDEMSLLVVDHKQDTEVYADLNCNVNLVHKPVEIISATDENGEDISLFVQKDDEIFWQTKLPFDVSKANTSLRHTLTFTFPRPEDKKSAKLIINAGTSLWGSQMIREMQTLYGDQIDVWYEQIDKKGKEKKQMMEFIEREELYVMNALIKEDNKWEYGASINGGGPFIVETRTYDLDLANVNGDTLFMRFNIPYGFWTLNYLAVEYENNDSPTFQELKISNAINHNEKNIEPTLIEKDDNYYEMPIVGDYFYAEFDAPPIIDGYDRTIFLKSHGYYKLHLKKDQPMQTQKLFNIGTMPGEIVKYSLDRFGEWEKQYSQK